jgi:thiol-disulfide isomerase/thioredoxin
MKKIILFSSFLCSFYSQSQLFSDNFDSYSAGSYLCSQSGDNWTTFDNQAGGNQDVLVSNTDASSAPNSLHFVSSLKEGGPSTIVRQFGVLQTGQLSLQFKMKVNAQSAAYFDLNQSSTLEQGNSIFSAYFRDNGTFEVAQIPGFSVAYPQGSWFDFRLDIDFNTSMWKMYFNDASVGEFTTEGAKVAALLFFPVDADSPHQSDFFVDDFSSEITPFTLPTINASCVSAGTKGANVVQAEVHPQFRIRNFGVNAITSFDATAYYNGITTSQSFSGLSVASLDHENFDFSSTIRLVVGPEPLTVTISNVNGSGADGISTDDQAVISLDPIAAAAGKMVVSEEATGTWCGYCVRGAYYMDQMQELYKDYWVGIAVHNNDPMKNTEYDAGVVASIAGFPTVLVDRKDKLDPSEMEQSILNRLKIDPKALIRNGATWNPGTRNLDVSITAEFQAGATNKYKLLCVLTEDGVTGVSSGYAQSNYYAGNQYGMGALGGYELLPAVIPASTMVYDHVARMIEPSYRGTSEPFPSGIKTGEKYTINVSFVLPAGWNENNISIIGMLIDPYGRVDNASKATLVEASKNGFITGSYVTAVNELEQIDDLFTLYPNPAKDQVALLIQLRKESIVGVKIFDVSGKTVAARDYGALNGASSVLMPTSNMEAGMYWVELTVDHQKIIKRLAIE